jgi:zinc/manganese transport system permease protein
VNALREMLSYGFMVNAFRAGAIVAIVAGPVGWFMILRRQTFAGHTLAVVGFPGAGGAILAGFSPTLGYFGSCFAAALVIAGTPRARSVSTGGDPAVIGTTQAFLLGFGFLFVRLYGGNLNGLDSLLFGSFLGISPSQVLALLLVAVSALLVLAAIGRRLLFASVDPVVATAAGIPVQRTSMLFLLLLAGCVAEVAQITGALLVFALLVLPAAAAREVTSRPVAGIVVASFLALAASWIGLTISFYSNFPTGLWVTTVAFAAYVVVKLWRLLPSFGPTRTQAGPG